MNPEASPNPLSEYTPAQLRQELEDRGLASGRRFYEANQQTPATPPPAPPATPCFHSWCKEPAEVMLLTAWGKSSFLVGKEGKIPTHEFLQLLRAFMGLAYSAAQPAPQTITPGQAQEAFDEIKQRRHDLTLFALCEPCALQSQGNMQKRLRPGNLPVAAPDPEPELPGPPQALSAESKAA